MEPVRCALVGHGMIGREHARILASNSGASLLVVCDSDRSVSDEIPAGVGFTTDLTEALETEGLEAVWVCTPQQVHLQAVEAALERGLHVFCEKPIASSLSDAKKMVALDNSSVKTLAIGHTLRFHPDFLAIREAVTAGKLGQIVQIAARLNVPDHEGEVLSGRTTVAQELAIHYLDIMRWFAGDIERVYAEVATPGVVGPGPDAMVATVRFQSGAVGVLDHNWIMADKTGMNSEHRFAVFGSQGAAYIETRDTSAVIFGSDGMKQVRSDFFSYPHDIPMGALPAEDTFFLSTVRDGRPWPLTVTDAVAALTAALAIDLSIAESRPVLLSEVEESNRTGGHG